MVQLYARDGSEIDLWQFCRLWDDPTYRIVAQDHTRTALITTTWRGSDPDERTIPHIFVTAITRGDKVEERTSSDVYEARCVHERAVEQLHARDARIAWAIVVLLGALAWTFIALLIFML